MTTKLITSTILGTSVIGGASAGCYYCFKPKAPESSKSTSSTKNQETRDNNSDNLQTSLAPEGSAGSRTIQNPPAAASFPQGNLGVNSVPNSGSEPGVVSPT